MILDILPAGLGRDMDELDRVSTRKDLIDQRLNARRVVIPPPSVHVRCVLEGDGGGGGVVVGSVQCVVDIFLRVGAGHGCKRTRLEASRNVREK